jgi:hypothetical protein
MRPDEKQRWESFRKKGPRHFILLYGVGYFASCNGAFWLWSAYRQGEDTFWFLAPFVVVMSVIGGVAMGGLVWFLYEGRYNDSSPNEEDGSPTVDQR